MTRYLVYLLIIALPVFAVAQTQTNTPLTAEHVLLRHIETIGGVEKLSKITDRTIKLSGTYDGAAVKIEIYQKAPDKYISKLFFGFLEQTIRYYDGKGIKSSPLGEETLEGDELLRLRLQADILALTHLTQLGIIPVLDSIVTIDHRACYKVKFVYPSGNFSSAFYDTASFYKVREESTVRTETEQFIQSTVFSDFRQAGGLIYPYIFTQAIGDKKVISVVDTITINSGLNDSVFEENVSVDH